MTAKLIPFAQHTGGQIAFIDINENGNNLFALNLQIESHYRQNLLLNLPRKHHRGISVQGNSGRQAINDGTKHHGIDGTLMIKESGRHGTHWKPERIRHGTAHTSHTWHFQNLMAEKKAMLHTGTR